MNKLKGRTVRLLVMAFVVNMLFSNTAFAYVDPGSGSVIVATILGVIASLGYTVRKYFYRIKRMVSGQKVEKNREG